MENQSTIRNEMDTLMIKHHPFSNNVYLPETNKRPELELKNFSFVIRCLT